MADDSLALDPALTVRRALRFWSDIGGIPAKLDNAIDALGLTHLAEVPVRLLSNGQAKRATLARVAASGAPLWLLDEPLNGLDTNSKERLDALLAAHRSDGGAVIVASHLPLAGRWDRLELSQ